MAEAVVRPFQVVVEAAAVAHPMVTVEEAAGEDHHQPAEVVVVGEEAEAPRKKAQDRRGHSVVDESTVKNIVKNSKSWKFTDFGPKTLQRWIHTLGGGRCCPRAGTEGGGGGCESS